MVHSRVRVLVSWIYLLPNWLTPPPPLPLPLCLGPDSLQLRSTMNMLVISGIGGELKGGGAEIFPVLAEVFCVLLSSSHHH